MYCPRSVISLQLKSEKKIASFELKIEDTMVRTRFFRDTNIIIYIILDDIIIDDILERVLRKYDFLKMIKFHFYDFYIVRTRRF